MKRILNAVLALCAMAATGLHGQSLSSLFSFSGANGEYPYAGTLIQATDGNLYGTTSSGGEFGGGTIFNITPTGTLTTLYNFCSLAGCLDGQNPYAGLLQASDGNFYGTTEFGGANTTCSGGCGTVFELTPTGTLTTLYSFCTLSACADGRNPAAALVVGTNGNFYGTTSGGTPESGAVPPYGTVFEITSAGVLTTLHSFCAQGSCTDGAFPYAPLVQTSNGNFYGTTSTDGAGNGFGGGTIFEISPSGTFNTVYKFQSPNGFSPVAGLIQGSDGNLYGTTAGGGTNGEGTVFKTTLSGTLTTLYSFCASPGCPDGSLPFGGLVQATDGNLYGTNYSGGNAKVGGGTLFEITTAGTLTTLYKFCSQGAGACTDGQGPFAGLIQATNGEFYGTTALGGSTPGDGTVFRLATGLGPFVKTHPASGVVGAPVEILGTNLTGVVSVTFHGTPAKFTVVSSSEISTTVPTGATTGTVKVTTLSTTLSSNKSFTVLP